jgi:heat shock protein HtpX
MAYLDEDQHRRARLRNIAQSVALIAGIGAITALSAYTLFGSGGIVWALTLVGFFALIGPRVAPDAIMRMFNARPIDPSRGAEILRIVRTLSERAELPAIPRLYVIPSATLNAFAIGTPSRYSIGVTEGLLQRLDTRELAGVLAHEIAHVRNNDVWVMSLADILSRLTRIMSFLAVVLFFVSVPAAFMTDARIPWAAIGMLYFAPTLSSLLQLALSRAREYDADLGGATLTGDPEALASALGKLERYQGRFWEDIVMPGRRIPAPSVLRTHPETSQRIERLLALKKPVASALSFPPMQGQMAAFGSVPMRPHFHWNGFWF